ncbi:MAG: outer membrane protein assembly factor BamB family protein [Vulcanimicrobiaceae bacterium]
MSASTKAQQVRYGALAVAVLLLAACASHGNGGIPSVGSHARQLHPNSVSGAFEQLVLQSSPTQYFELEDAACCTATNIGSSGSNGTYASSNITYSLPGPLRDESSTAIGLPGNTGSVGINVGVSLPNPSTSGAFTVEDWVYPIFATAGSRNAFYTIWGYDGTHRLLINNQSGSQGKLLTQFGNISFTSTGALSGNAWNQVVFVYDGTKEYFYINGAIDSSLTKSGVALSAAYYLGQYDTGSYYKLDGRIGQHMVFRSALSASVIQNHFMTATSGTQSPTPSPTTTPTAAGPKLVQHTNGALFAPSAITVSFATAPASGDTLLVFFNNNGNTSGNANTYTAPSGWTQIDIDTAHAGNTYEAFYHVAGIAESNSYIFAPSCACREHVWNAAEYSNARTTSPIDRHGFNFISNTASWTTPVETPSQTNDLAVVSMMPTTNGRTWINASGWAVELGPSATWSGELLQKLQTATSSVSETSSLSGPSTGYAAIVLLAPQPPKHDWATWGMSPYRNSYNPFETTLTSKNVGGLHQIWATTAGGVFTDEPVVAANVPGTSMGTTDLLFVGDAHANLYAMNAGTGKVLWRKTLQTQVLSSTTGCVDQPGRVYGIGGSPTVDRSRSLVYVVDGLGNLYAFDLATGNQKAGPVAMWPFLSGVNITNDYGALNEDSRAGVIYVPAGAHCGLANYGGVERYTISTGAVAHFYTEGGPPNTFGGVWGPGGAVIDPRNATNSVMNDIYFGTGDGPIGTGQYPYSIVRLSESLRVVAANNVVSSTFSRSIDLDYGDTPLVFAPSSSGCGRMLVAAESKNAKLYVYDADNINGGPLQTIQLGTLSQSGNNLGTAAYDPTHNLVFIQNGSDSSNTASGIRHGLVAFTVTAGCQLQLAWQQTVGPNQTVDGPPEPPTVANGVVYYTDGPGTGCSAVGNTTCTETSDFYAFNASNGQMLLHATLPGPLFTPPVVVNGHVYLTSWNGGGPGTVYSFGL